MAKIGQGGYTSFSLSLSLFKRNTCSKNFLIFSGSNKSKFCSKSLPKPLPGHEGSAGFQSGIGRSVPRTTNRGLTTNSVGRTLMADNNHGHIKNLKSIINSSKNRLGGGRGGGSNSRNLIRNTLRMNGMKRSNKTKGKIIIIINNEKRWRHF